MITFWSTQLITFWSTSGPAFGSQERIDKQCSRFHAAREYVRSLLEKVFMEQFHNSEKAEYSVADLKSTIPFAKRRQAKKNKMDTK